MNLDTDHLTVDGDSIQHERVQHLADHNRHPEYVELDAVAGSEGAVYLVGVVDVLTKPFAEADVAKDRTEVALCSCSDFFFRRSNGSVERDDPLDLSEWSECKHIEAWRQTNE